MAELDADRAAALRRAIEREFVPGPQGTQLACFDVSGDGLAWDFELRSDPDGSIVRRISHTRAADEQVHRGMAHVVDDVWPTVESSLGDLGVKAVWITIHVHCLPTSRRERQHLARMLARRIFEHIVTGTPILRDPFRTVLSGGAPIADPVSDAFAMVRLAPAKPADPARILSMTADVLTRFVPPPAVVAKEAVARKAVRHQGSASRITLVVEVGPDSLGPDDAAQLGGMLEESERKFEAILLARFDLSRGEYSVHRVFEAKNVVHSD